MNADYQDFKYKELTEKIIKIFYRVYNNLGYGFLEKVYPVKQLKERCITHMYCKANGTASSMRVLRKISS